LQRLLTGESKATVDDGTSVSENINQMAQSLELISARTEALKGGKVKIQQTAEAVTDAFVEWGKEKKNATGGGLLQQLRVRAINAW
jgi:hypothetical protein